MTKWNKAVYCECVSHGANPILVIEEVVYYSYQEQINIVKDIRIKEDQTKRIMCPFCFGVNTFTLTNKSGDLLWNCYKASCTAKGLYKGIASVESLRNKINNVKKETNIIKNPIPSILSEPTNHKVVLDWLESNNCLDQVIKNEVTVKYSPKERRVLFFYPNNLGALGRTLIPGHMPKWKQFGDTTGLFVAGTGSIAVVVEDCVSAVAVSQLKSVTGISLSGTNLSTKQKHLLSKYSSINISLDKDASRKAKQLVEQLIPFSSVTTTLIEKDLKLCTNLELKIFEEKWRLRNEKEG